MYFVKTFLVVFTLTVALGAAPVGAAASTVKVVEGNSAFAVDLFGQLRDDPGNMVFSPYSVSTVLAMLYAGARGNTAMQMTRTLHVELGTDRYPRAYSELAQQLSRNAESGGYEYRSANALFFQMGFPLETDFLSIQQESYGGIPQELDFASNPEAQRVRINNWVSEQTKDRIRDLMAPGTITGLTRLVLVNALYFKGHWDVKFDNKLTTEDVFITSAGGKLRVKMMNQVGEYLYGEFGDVKVLSLPYTGKKYSMVFILPSGKKLTDIEQGLDVQRLQQYMMHLKTQKVRVMLPKFEAETSFILNDKLKSLGMSDLFDGNLADFSGVDGRQDLYVSLVVHKAFVEVDESGAEAAAAGAAVMTLRAMSADHQEIQVFRADHPFTFLIRDNQTGSILFMGHVNAPQQE